MSVRQISRVKFCVLIPLAFLGLWGSGAFAAVARAPITPAPLERMVVDYPADYPAGTIVIQQSQRRLYLILGHGTAISYPVAIGKPGKAWTGWAMVKAKYVNPAWAAPDSVRKDNPDLPKVIAGGAPRNPMGMRALALDLDEIAIHGTAMSMRASIGSAASYGCIRMLNEHIVDLYDRVQVGTKVVAIR